jgi:hypothetical protein
MQPPQWLARFNRHFTNPIQRMLCRPIFAPAVRAGGAAERV